MPNDIKQQKEIEIANATGTLDDILLELDEGISLE